MVPAEKIAAVTSVRGAQTVPLALLVKNAADLHLLSYKFATVCMAENLQPRGGATVARQARQILMDISAAWSALRNSETNFLSSFDPTFTKIMGGAFSRDAIRNFNCFECMARNICQKFSDDISQNSADLAELSRFVSEELFDTFNGIVSAARLVSELGGREVEKLALTDELTGLPNRRALHEFLDRMDSSGWPNDHMTIMRVDLDRFKQINDTLGHAAGDAALLHASGAMASHVRREDFLSRVGGDEFVFLIFGKMPNTSIAKKAKEIIDDISTSFAYKGKNCSIGASIGIAGGDRLDGVPLERYMIDADLALYAAKEKGRGTCSFFTPNQRTKFEEAEELHASIRSGLENGEFEPYFQPQVEGRSGKLVGIESLARWHHPTKGLLTPFHFLEAARDASLLEQLDLYLMERAFVAMRQWLFNGLEIPQISINMTAERLYEIDLVDTLILAASKADLDPSFIGIEILESAMIDKNSHRMIQNIQKLSGAGFKVELDDFGTGHASISNLRHFKVDRIKIDKSFVKDVHIYPELAKITSAMIGLAHSLRVDALAEGVETPEERLVLNALGCDHIQGYGVSHPMPGADIPLWISATQKTKSLPPRRGNLTT